MERKLLKVSLGYRESIAFRIHLVYSFIEGIILGIIALNEFVFIKSLFGKPYQLALLFQFSMLVFLFSAFVNRFFSTRRKTVKIIRITGLVTRVPFILFLFFPPQLDAYNQFYIYCFLCAFLLYYLANPLIYPNINYFLKNSYQHENFGYLYSMSTSLNKIVMMIVTFIYGLMLDANPMAFRYVLPFAGILAVISSYILTLIPYKERKLEQHEIFPENRKIIGPEIREMFGILKSNRPFLLFQFAFMFYGLSFMIGTPSVNIFFKEILDLNYSSVAFYRNAYNIFAIAVLPFMGKLLGRTGPMRFGIITFSSLLLYFLFVILTGIFPVYFDFLNIRIYHIMLIALIFHGLFASTMSLLWNIGSAYFGKSTDAGTYQNIHLFLTGIRAIPTPFIGIWIYEEFGYIACFTTTLILLTAGILVIRRTLRNPPEQILSGHQT